MSVRRRAAGLLRAAPEQEALVDVAAGLRPADIARRFWPRLRPLRGWLLLGLLLLTAAPAIAVAEAFLYQRLVDDVLVPAAFEPLLALALLYIGLNLASGVVSGADDYLATFVSQRFLVDLRRDVFAHVLSLPAATHDRRRLGDTLTRLTSDVAAVERFMVTQASEGVGALVRLLVLVGALMWMDWRAGARLARRGAALLVGLDALRPPHARRLARAPAPRRLARERDRGGARQRRARAVLRPRGPGRGVVRRPQPCHRRRRARCQQDPRAVPPARRPRRAGRRAGRRRPRRLVAGRGAAHAGRAAGLPHPPDAVLRAGAHAGRPGACALLRQRGRRAGRRAARRARRRRPRRRHAAAGRSGRASVREASYAYPGARDAPRSTGCPSTSRAGETRRARRPERVGQVHPRVGCCRASSSPTRASSRSTATTSPTHDRRVGARRRHGRPPGTAPARRVGARQPRLGRPDATRAEVRAAARDAGAHEFVEALPHGLRHPDRPARPQPVGRSAAAARARAGPAAARAGARAGRADDRPRRGGEPAG